MPGVLNEGRKYSDAVLNSFINGIATSEDEFGYTISFEQTSYTGFVRSGPTLKIGRVYTLEIESKAEKVLVCRLPGQTGPATMTKTPKWSFMPGTLWECHLAKEVEGGAILRIDNSDVLGYVFVDHALALRKKVVARLISFDYHLKNLQFSLQHAKLKEFVCEAKVGATYNAVRVVRQLFGGSYLVRPLVVAELDKKKKKQADPEVISEGPLGFLHSSQLWAAQIPDFEMPKLEEVI
jgi:hypothetical protein